MKYRIARTVAVAAAALTIASCSSTPDTQSASPSSSPTASATSTPTRSATPEPDETPRLERAVTIDDETILARITAPRTGEVWHSPVPYTPEIDFLRPEMGADRFEYFSVGDRGDAEIIVAVEVAEPLLNGARLIPAMYEVDSAGVRAIACPSALTTDPCALLDFVLPDAIEIDGDTFYDSMTLPSEITAMEGFTLLVKETRVTTLTWDPYGQGQLMAPTAPGTDGAWPWAVTREVWSEGGLSVVEMEKPSLIEAMPSISYALVTPAGTMVLIETTDIPGGDYDAITWDDGVIRTYGAEWGGIAPVTAPADRTCFGGPFTRDSNHVDADWVKAGVTDQGLEVFIPPPGGSPLSLQLWSQLAENSGTFDEAGNLVAGVDAYTYKTHEDFLAANALFAVQWPNGVWVLAARYDAASTVWECA